MSEINSTTDFLYRFEKGESPRFIYGTTPEAKELIDYYQAHQVSIDGVVDGFYASPHFHGLPVLRSDALPEQAMVINAVTCANTITIKRILEQKSAQQLDVFAIMKHSDIPMSGILYWQGFPEIYRQHQATFDALRERLSDELSKQVFDKLIAFKLSYDSRHIADFTFTPPSEMYFEPFLNQPGERYFIDVGAFDGQNSQAYIQRYPKSKTVLFEPVPEQFQSLQAGFHQDHRYLCINAALGSKPGWANMEFDGSSSSLIDAPEDAPTVQLTTLDIFCHENPDVIPSYIKLDVEGFEMEVLNGAVNTINKHRPNLAISAYHRADDFVQIYHYLSQLADYDIFMRHYTCGYCETVIFAVPK
ncbi:FkbM family methyltransferase [Vibrio sp. DNB22_10_4]